MPTHRKPADAEPDPLDARTAARDAGLRYASDARLGADAGRVKTRRARTARRAPRDRAALGTEARPRA